MFTSLRLKNFKSFREATLPLGPLTVIVGANASGKSNLRDAFRFLHGVGRGYGVAEILGGRWGAGGNREWTGIRGGVKEAAFTGKSRFELETDVGSSAEDSVHYAIGIDCAGDEPGVYTEKLDIIYRFEKGRWHFNAAEYHEKRSTERPRRLQAPALGQDDIAVTIHETVCRHTALTGFTSLRFLDLVPDAMREPSPIGLHVLGDRGENLSSVLKLLCDDPSRKATLLEWTRQLLPADVVDFQFPEDFTRRVLLHLVEASGRVTSAYSASDGTLRFLALLAALFLPDVPVEAFSAGQDHAAGVTFFLEEIDNGIHPTRLHLLLQLLESRCFDGRAQVIATTHSPFLLTQLSPRALEHAVLVHRPPGRDDSHIVRIVDLPDARRVLATQDIARLHASGWLEDIAGAADEEAHARGAA